MEKELSHSLNVILSPHIAELLRNIQKEILTAVSERRPYDNSPHLSLVNKFMGKSQTAAFVNTLTKEFRDDSSWELTFADFSPSPTNEYIFLNVDKDSQKRLRDMHARAFAVTRGIGTAGQNGIDIPKYPYVPHVSIIKLQPEETEKSLRLIAHELSGITMPVKNLEITTQKDMENGFSIFPIIATIELK